MTVTAPAAACPCAEAVAEAQALLDRLKVLVEQHACPAAAEADPAPHRPTLTLVGGRAS